jgi:hypothetical protein
MANSSNARVHMRKGRRPRGIHKDDIRRIIEIANRFNHLSMDERVKAAYEDINIGRVIPRKKKAVHSPTPFKSFWSFQDHTPRRTIPTSDLANVFGIDLELPPDPTPIIRPINEAHSQLTHKDCLQTVRKLFGVAGNYKVGENGVYQIG